MSLSSIQATEAGNADKPEQKALIFSLTNKKVFPLKKNCFPLKN